MEVEVNPFWAVCYSPYPMELEVVSTHYTYEEAMHEFGRMGCVGCTYFVVQFTNKKEC